MYWLCFLACKLLTTPMLFSLVEDINQRWKPCIFHFYFLLYSWRAYTSLYLDEAYYEFWKVWQAVTYSFVPFILLTIINLKIWWNIKASSQNVYVINSMNIALREKQDKKSFIILFTVVITFLVCNLLKFVVDIYIIRYNPTKQYDFCAEQHK